MKKIVIDIQQVNKENLSLGDFFYLCSLYYKVPFTEDTFNNLHLNGLVYLERSNSKGYPERVEITREGVEVFERIIANSEYIEPEKEKEKGNMNIEKLADAMRELFPKGKKEGTNCMWRDSTHIIASRLKLLAKKYNITWDYDKVLKATKRYVESFNGDYTYMQVLKYFISKKNMLTGEDNSQLLSFLDNEDFINNSNNDWTAELV
jgi:hypothetical protein